MSISFEVKDAGENELAECQVVVVPPEDAFDLMS